jgi:hypothetical protein
MVIKLIISIVIAIFATIIFGRDNPPKTDFFDPYLMFMPGEQPTIVEGCTTQIFEMDNYHPMEIYFYCPNFTEDVHSLYATLNEDRIVTYLAIRPKNLRYGDLIAILGQPTTLIRGYNGRISNLYFGRIYVILVDKKRPLDYNSRVLTVGFMENPFDA